eukprot:5608642-Pleurochrysis_carterae.AAC.1
MQLEKAQNVERGAVGQIRPLTLRCDYAAGRASVRRACSDGRKATRKERRSWLLMRREPARVCVLASQSAPGTQLGAASVCVRRGRAP